MTSAIEVRMNDRRGRTRTRTHLDEEPTPEVDTANLLRTIME
jgi:hypothetical protein